MSCFPCGGGLTTRHSGASLFQDCETKGEAKIELMSCTDPKGNAAAQVGLSEKVLSPSEGLPVIPKLAGLAWL